MVFLQSGKHNPVVDFGIIPTVSESREAQCQNSLQGTPRETAQHEEIDMKLWKNFCATWITIRLYSTNGLDGVLVAMCRNKNALAHCGSGKTKFRSVQRMLWMSLYWGVSLGFLTAVFLKKKNLEMSISPLVLMAMASTLVYTAVAYLLYYVGWIVAAWSFAVHYWRLYNRLGLKDSREVYIEAAEKVQALCAVEWGRKYLELLPDSVESPVPAVEPLSLLVRLMEELHESMVFFFGESMVKPPKEYRKEVAASFPAVSSKKPDSGEEPGAAAVPK